MTPAQRAKAALEDYRDDEIGWERWIANNIGTILEALEQMADEGKPTALHELYVAAVDRTKRSNYQWSKLGAYMSADWKNEGAIEMAHDFALVIRAMIAAQESSGEGGG